MSKATEKVKVQVLRPLVWKGERVERGVTLEVNPDDVKQLDAEYVKVLKLSKGKAAKQDDESSDSKDEDEQENEDQKPEDQKPEGDEIDV